jgi:hypothetical protein
MDGEFAKGKGIASQGCGASASHRICTFWVYLANQQYQSLWPE